MASLSATAWICWAAGDSGESRTIGVPASPPLRKVGSSGTEASSGTSWPKMTPRRSATICPPPVPKTSMVEPSGITMAPMFSITPATRWRVCWEMEPARSATSAAAACGVVTMSSSALGMSWATDRATSPVPGGRSKSSTSRSPQKTSARNCCSARWSMGPRQTTGALPSTNCPMEMCLMPWEIGGSSISSSSTVGPSVQPSRLGTE